MAETLRQRVGIDLSRKVAAEDGIEWGGKNGLTYMNFQADIAPNAFESFDNARCTLIRDRAEKHGIKIGLHTLSGVNTAELSPFLRDATDAYLRGYIDLAARLNAGWIVVHGGYHFTACRARRMDASIERLKRATAYAETKGVILCLENLNGEPERAEVHYLPDTLEDTLHYFEQIQSDHLQLAFTINHAHYDPIGIAGFVEGLDMTRCKEVRIADNNGLYEIHMQPGTGTVDFAEMFKSIEAGGFTGHYMCGFGSLDDMVVGRDDILDLAKGVGLE